MKILITGAAGFIGSNFVRYILNKYPEYKIVVLDKLTYAGRRENLKDIIDKIEFIQGDICCEELVETIVKKVDSIIHFAAESHVDRSIEKASEFINTNINGTFVLLEAARRNKIKRYLQVSTDEVYGSLTLESLSSTETDHLKPRSPYSSSKASGDLLTLSYYTTYDLPVIITRASNNYGLYQFPEKLIPLFITNLIEDKKVPLMGDGSNIRDWLYVLDHCSGIDVAFHKGELGNIYNIGGDNERTNRQITDILLKETEKDESYIKTIPHRLGHDFRYSLSSKKINKLGWAPEKSFENGIIETIKWYKNNEWWWKPLKKIK